MSGSDDPMSEPRTSSRPSLMERLAARTGYAIPTLDTELINNCAVSNTPQVLTIPFPTDLSPMTLLDSPDFIPNSLIHPSPTTGKFMFASCGNDKGITLSTNECNKEKISEDINGPSFAFQPVQGQANIASVNAEEEHASPELNEDGDQSNIVESGPPEDGYNWRKYGQKQAKGGECPRSYYKCTYLNCPVKKKVERSLEGHVTQIIYRGSHNHPKPPPNRRSSLGSTSIVGEMQRTLVGLDHFSGATHTALLGPNSATKYQSGDTVDLSSFSNDDSTSLGREGEGDESESKRRKIESHASDMSGGATASRAAIREPRVVVQTTSDVDILDDGYRWRKYGQKVVKGNPNPRSYYKCTTEGCNVRKHVERAPNDLKSVITTYEGKHNHDVPAPRNSVNSNQINRPVPSQVSANAACRFNQMPSMGSFVLPNPPQVGPGPGLGFGMSRHGLPRLGLSGLGPSQGALPPVRYPYLGHGQSQAQVGMNEMSFMVPRELNAEAGLGSSSMYNQLGPHI